MALCVVFLGYFINQFSSFHTAVTWVAVVYVSYIPRIFLSIIFNRKLNNNEITKDNIRPWENYHFLNTILPFACFTAVIFLPYGENEFIGMLLCTIAVITMIAGGVLLYSTSKKMILMFINFTMLSLIARCLWVQELRFSILAIFLITSYFFLTKLIFTQNRILLENIALKIENRKQSFIDPLTELWNRRRLYLFIGKVIELSKRSSDPFSLILLDIDHFKQYNDTHGHNAGDDILIKISGILLDCSREQDLVVRYGGEEFMVVLPNTSIGQAEIIAERILTNVRKNTDVTISAGLAQYTGQTNFDQLVHQADEALYAAKNSGRDRFVMAAAG